MKMTRIFRMVVFLALVVCLLLGSIPVSAVAPTTGKLEDGDITWVFNTETGHLNIYGSGEMVTDDDPAWLDHKDSIKSVEISNGITTIGDGAFYGCYNLTDIKIPDTVTHIRYRAFMFCESLAAIQLPKNLFKIGERAFSECTALTSIVLPDTVRYINGYAFDGCNFKELRLNEGIETISPFALHNIEVASLVIPRSVRKIENNAFNGSEFGQLILQEGLQSIDYYAFWGCTMEAPLILPASVHTVADSAFRTAVFPYIVIKNPNCDFGDQTVYPPFSSGTTIYAHSNSTASTLVSNFSRYNYVFKPMYFNDVAPGAWYFDAVSYAKENSLFDGVGNGKFAPETNMTRAMMVQVLYNYAGEGEICENTFTDVPDNTWYTDAVAWAAKNGIVNGVGGGKFNPEGKLTREQLSSIMFRFANWQGEDTSKTDDLTSFVDVGKVSDWALSSVKWAVGQGLINGVDQNGSRYLQPQAYASRAQVATILMRYIEQNK